MPVNLPIRLCPGLLQDPDSRHFLQPSPFLLHRDLVNAGEQGVAILANGRTERLAFGHVFGKAVVFDTLSVALKPFRLVLTLELLKRDRREHIEDMPQGFANQFELVEGFDGSQYMR